METPVTKALSSLQMNMPVANQQLANQRKAASTITMQQLGNQAITQNVPVQQAIPAVATQAATQSGQQQVQNANTQAQTVGQIASVNQQEQQTQNSVTNAVTNRNINETQFSGEQRLARLSETAKAELFDSRLQLIKDQDTNKFLNEKQMMDLAMLKGINDEKFQDYQQTLEHATTRKLQIMQTAYNAIELEMQRAQALGEQELSTINHANF